jgi:hypothetical protein
MGIKYPVNEYYFRKWSPEMAYTLGYLYADGSMEDASYLRGKYIRVSSVEKKNIEKIRERLNSEHTIVEIKPISKNRQKRYLLRIGSHMLYNDLISLGLFPKKSLTVGFPNIRDKYLSNFVLGYFDGDGCVRICRARGKKKDWIIKKLSIVFTSGSENFLKKLAVQLQKKLATNQMNVYNGHRSFMLSYSTEDSMKIFEFLYGNTKKGVFLERKFDVFCEYLKLRPGRIDSKIKSIIKSLNYGRMAK